MIAGLEMWLSDMPWLTLLAFFIDVTLKGAVICAVAGVVTLLLRRSSAFVRDTVWVFALVGLVLLPAFCLLSPLWNLPIIPELASWGAGSYTSSFEKPDPVPFVGPPFVAQGDAQVAAGSASGPASTGVPTVIPSALPSRPGFLSANRWMWSCAGSLPLSALTRA